MKTRELSADEITIQISAEDISSIPTAPNPDPLIDGSALNALRTGLSIRGTGTNIFVCGPSGPEREAAVLWASKEMRAGKTCDIVICENPDNKSKPLIKEFNSGGADLFIREEKQAGRQAEILVNQCDKPVIIETNPVPGRLFGIDSPEISGVRAGSLERSAGGILLLSAEDIISEEESWKLLKRILRTGKATIGAEAVGAESYNPEPRVNLVLPELELDLKVVILGNEAQYDLLYNSDEDFRDLFIFFAELDSVIDLNTKNLADTVNGFRNYTSEKLGKKLTDGGALEAVKYSIASAENNTKLSTLHTEIEQLLTEAAFLPGHDNENLGAEQVQEAVKNQADRFSLLERRIIEDIKNGEINLKVDGLETGKVNGLAVIDKGPWAFGFPGLISARIAPGENGLVNIEHEAGLSGEIHDKWVLILEGFLRRPVRKRLPALDFCQYLFRTVIQ